MQNEFLTLFLENEEYTFQNLAASVRFEKFTNGREGAILVKPDGKRGTPLVRTTSDFAFAAQHFGAPHLRLAEEIREMAGLQDEFNNALIEIYSNAYYKMGAHSDQALDLEEGTSIALFSCYRYPERVSTPRRLVVKSKDLNAKAFEIPLLNNSVVVFSLETNQRYRHKISLDVSGAVEENQWLGVTYRRSKTFVHTHEGEAFFEDGSPLSLATDDERKEFYQMRGKENRLLDFRYPKVPYTISKSDLL